MPDTPKKFYLTTPIYYVNARPHIGHAYSTIAADVIARRHRLLGDDTFFLTGTDEHGQKVQRSAEKAGVPPQQFADEVSATFRDLWARMGITNDDYIRTTDERHKRGVQKLWKHLEERGAIYLSTYTGQYSVGEEMFVEGPPGTIGPDGKPTETVTEENYFFKLSEYQERLINLIESGELHFQPETAKNEILSFLRGDLVEARAADLEIARSNSGFEYVKGALRDLSISRTTFDWGIQVPGNPKHVIYVWLDALANYMTAVGYGSDDPADIAKFERYWPADLHLVGKEITRQHCIYWPAFLMAAGIPLPKSVVANGWLLFEESKMSKSRGNVVRTETILDAFGPLCPPVPPLFSSGNAPLLSSRSEAEGSASPEAPQLSTEAKNESSSGLQPAVSTPNEGGALAPGLASPTKAQQDLFAADVLRYFLLREIPFGQDGSFSFDALITRYNADLANGYGNLVSRTLSMIQKFFDGNVPAPTQTTRANVTELIDAGIFQVGRALSEYDFGKAMQLLQTMVAVVDGDLTISAPWKQGPGVPDDFQRTHQANTLWSAAESIRIITSLLHPVMPYATASVWRQLGLGSIATSRPQRRTEKSPMGRTETRHKTRPPRPHLPPSRQRTRPDHDRHGKSPPLPRPPTPQPIPPHPPPKPSTRSARAPALRRSPLAPWTWRLAPRPSPSTTSPKSISA